MVRQQSISALADTTVDFNTCYYDEGRQRVVCDPPRADPDLLAAVTRARTNNMAVVCAAGNGDLHRDGIGDDNDSTFFSPASFALDNVISVLATDRFDNKTTYSNFGRYRVDLGAPGGTNSDSIIGLKQDFNNNSSDSNNYSFLYGTSMATPHVTGALALIKSRFPWENYLGIRDRVLMGTDHLGNLTCRTGGRLNLYKALQTRSMIRNLSTRARVEDGDRVMIGGFTISGRPEDRLKVAIPGIGPSLTSLVNVQTLSDPKITLYDNLGQVVAVNDDWENNNPGMAADLIASGVQPTNPKEAALIGWLWPGRYTVKVESNPNSGQFGVGMFEIYELQGNTNEPARLVNMSTRCLVGTGDEVAIAGTMIGNLNPPNPNNPEDPPRPDRRLLIFGKGPSLSAYVSGFLSDPQIQVYPTGGSNDQWQTIDDDSGDGHALEEKLVEAHFAPTQPAESALWPTFRPGSYTVRLSGANGSTGLGLIEFYEY
jgi:hypothetical protein